MGLAPACRLANSRSDAVASASNILRVLQQGTCLHTLTQSISLEDMPTSYRSKDFGGGISRFDTQSLHEDFSCQWQVEVVFNHLCSRLSLNLSKKKLIWLHGHQARLNISMSAGAKTCRAQRMEIDATACRETKGRKGNRLRLTFENATSW